MLGWKVWVSLKKLQEMFSLTMSVPSHALFLETFSFLFDQVKRSAEDGVYAYTCTDFMFSVFTFVLSPCIHSRDLVKIILVFLNTKCLLPDPNFQPWATELHSQLWRCRVNESQEQVCRIFLIDDCEVFCSPLPRWAHEVPVEGVSAGMSQCP